MREALEVADNWKRGITPDAGAYLDQTTSIVDACRQIWAEQARWRSEKKLLDLGD